MSLNNEFINFNDYLKTLRKKERKFIIKLIMYNKIPNLHLFTNLSEPMNFTEYISNALYYNYISEILFSKRISRYKKKSIINKSKLSICTNACDLSIKSIGIIYDDLIEFNNDNHNFADDEDSLSSITDEFSDDSSSLEDSDEFIIFNAADLEEKLYDEFTKSNEYIPLDDISNLDKLQDATI